MPDGTRVPKVDEQSVLNFLIHQKRTAPGPDEFPYWFWRDYAYHLAPFSPTLLKFGCVPMTGNI